MARTAKKSGTVNGRGFQYTTLKVRLYPSEAQAELFEKTFGCCRYIWNQMLSDQQRFYVETGSHFIPTPAKYKKNAPFLKEVDNQALIQEHNKLSQAFRVFFKNPETFGYPNFKRKKSDRDSFTACNQVFGASSTIYLTQNGIRMTKAGVVRARFSRRPRSGWKLKRITVDKTRTGKFFCSILFECPVKQPQTVVPAPEKTLGLKYSVSHFYVADDGGRADPPQWLRQSQEKLTRMQRKISRMQVGSRNYEAAVQKYRLLHEHIANQRKDFLHKESRRIANAWDAVCMRPDALKPLRSVPAAGYGMFRELLRYKLERQGKALILVKSYAPTTRTCSACGTIREAVSYKRTVWTCPTCGAVHQREVNAARNIKAEGLAQFSRMQELRGAA